MRLLLKLLESGTRRPACPQLTPAPAHTYTRACLRAGTAYASEADCCSKAFVKFGLTSCVKPAGKASPPPARTPSPSPAAKPAAIKVTTAAPKVTVQNRLAANAGLDVSLDESGDVPAELLVEQPQLAAATSKSTAAKPPPPLPKCFKKANPVPYELCDRTECNSGTGELRSRQAAVGAARRMLPLLHGAGYAAGLG